MGAAAIGILAILLSSCGTTGPAHSGRSGSDYVALGDSYTAFPGTTLPVEAACNRSGSNYPHQVAKALGMSLTDVSCGGARTADLTASQKPGVPPQLDALGTSTRLVTVSIGVNNNAVSAVLLIDCRFVRAQDPTGAPCQNGTRTWAATAFDGLQSQLVASYQAIRARAPHARVIVIGYPEILGTSGACAKDPIATGDVAYINGLNTRLNAIVKAAAAAAGVEYLDLAGPSRHHGVCSRSPWINGQWPVPGVAAPMHPLPAEQKAVADLLESRLKSPAS